MKPLRILEADELWEKGVAENNPGMLLSAVLKALRSDNIKLAQYIAVDSATISHWKKRRYIPPKYQEKLWLHFLLQDESSWFDNGKRKQFADAWNMNVLVRNISTAVITQQTSDEAISWRDRVAKIGSINLFENADLGKIIRHRRKALDLSIYEFLALLHDNGCDISYKILLDIETGKTNAAKYLSALDAIFVKNGFVDSASLIALYDIGLDRTKTTEFETSQTLAEALQCAFSRYEKSLRLAAVDIASAESAIREQEVHYSRHIVGQWVSGEVSKKFPTRETQLSAIIATLKKWDIERSDNLGAKKPWFTTEKQEKLRNLWEAGLAHRRTEIRKATKIICDEPADAGPDYAAVLPRNEEVADIIWHSGISLGGRIKAVRVALGYSQKKLGALLGVSKTVVLDWEKMGEPKDRHYGIAEAKLFGLIELAEQHIPKWLDPIKKEKLITSWQNYNPQKQRGEKRDVAISKGNNGENGSGNKFKFQRWLDTYKLEKGDVEPFEPVFSYDRALVNAWGHLDAHQRIEHFFTFAKSNQLKGTPVRLSLDRALELSFGLSGIETFGEARIMQTFLEYFNDIDTPNESLPHLFAREHGLDPRNGEALTKAQGFAYGK